MKSSSPSLWQFIRSMTSNEKQFFRRNFIAAGDKPLYLLLFEAIEKQKEYDQEKIMVELAGEINRKNISFQKNYLFRQLCEALTRYHADADFEQEIYQDILLIRMFRKRGLTIEAQTLWEKAIRKARKIEAFAMMHLLKKEFEKMILWSNQYTHYEEMHLDYKKNILDYGHYSNIFTLRDLYAETLLLKRKAHFDLDPINKEKVAQLLEEVNRFDNGIRSPSFWYRHYLRMCKASLLYLLNSEMDKALLLINEAFNDWKEHPQYIQTSTENFIEIMDMINYTAIQQKKFSFVETVFADPVQEFILEDCHRANFEAIKYLALNKVYNKMARYEEVAVLVQNMKKKQSQWEGHLSPETSRTVCISLGIACFALEQYGDAYSFIKRIVMDYKDGTREEHINIAHLLLLLIAYNMNNGRLFEAQYRSTYNHFYKRKVRHPFENGLIATLNRSFYLNSYKEKVEEYKRALEIFEKNKLNEVQQKTFNVFNYPGWFESRIQRVTYRDYVKKQVKEKNILVQSELSEHLK